MDTNEDYARSGCNSVEDRVWYCRKSTSTSSVAMKHAAQARQEFYDFVGGARGAWRPKMAFDWWLVIMPNSNLFAKHQTKSAPILWPRRFPRPPHIPVTAMTFKLLWMLKAWAKFRTLHLPLAIVTTRTWDVILYDRELRMVELTRVRGCGIILLVMLCVSVTQVTG